MMEVNLGDMDNTSREQEDHWLLAIRAAQVAAMINRQWN
jgi:hypothetical protein